MGCTRGTLANHVNFGMASTALQGQSSCATQEAAERVRGKWHKKFGPLGPSILLVPPQRQRGGRGVDGIKTFGPRGLNLLCHSNLLELTTNKSQETKGFELPSWLIQNQLCHKKVSITIILSILQERQGHRHSIVHNQLFIRDSAILCLDHQLFDTVFMLFMC